MSYQLVVSEKPSVAMSYAKVLGATNRKDCYLEGNGYLVSWCVGHLVELAPPNIYDAKYVKWSIADLPILPQKWQYLVSASTKKQFSILKNLMHRADVDSIVNSCDSGREGELIFRLVYQQAGCKKPVSRLWLSSMEENAIREGFAHLKPSTEYDALYNAALCRERADWMVGINCSRLFSCLYGQPLAVGRVMTPVLAMTVVREAAIAAFTPEKFYTVDLELTSGCTASSRRIPEKAVAEKLMEACRKEMVATIQRITRKEKSENPPPLYDLTTLQRDANRLLGYSAQQTLDYVQSLYEKKLTTYPRTDSCYITDDDEEMLEELTEELEGFLDITPEDVDEAVPRTRRTVNREKVTDHHAILPTRSMLQADLDALPKGEQNVLKLIIARTLMAVSKPFRYLETLLTTECAGEEFTAKGKEILEEGWKAVERKVLADILNRKQELTALPNAAENECGILNAELKEGQTSPPKHFTEDTLLHAMETASADSMPEGVERQGIGTPATRAATIEKLVQKGFLERKGTKKTKVLLPTDKGKALITVMPEEIQSPEMTADWETKLLQIERSEMEPETFMTEIKEMISSLVTTTEARKGANALMKNKIIGVCPNCGANVVEREKGWFCESNPCRFVLWKDNAFFKRLGKRLDAHVADKLLRDGRVRLKDCKSAKGKTYNATVLLSCEADGRSKFSLEFENGGALMKDDAVIKDNEAVYLLNEQTYLHLRENLAGVGYEVFDKNSPLPVEEGQIPREALGKTQRRIETARAYYLAEHQDEPVGKIQNVAVTTLEKFRSGVRKRRNLAPRSLPENDVRFIDPMYNELFRVPDGGVVQMTYPDGHQRSEKVEYLDDYHMKIGSSVQHICEFAERMARSRAIVEPEPLTQQDCRAWNLEYDYYLTVQADNGSWNYALYQGDCCLLERGKIDAPELMIEEVRDEIMYTHNLRNKDCIPLTQEEFTQKLADRNEIQSYRMKQFQQSGHDCYLVMQLQQDADPALRFAAMRYLEKKNIAPSIENYEILYRGNLPEGKRSVPQAELLEHLYQ